MYHLDMCKQLSTSSNCVIRSFMNKWRGLTEISITSIYKLYFLNLKKLYMSTTTSLLRTYRRLKQAEANFSKKQTAFIRGLSTSTFQNIVTAPTKHS